MPEEKKYKVGENEFSLKHTRLAKERKQAGLFLAKYYKHFSEGQDYITAFYEFVYPEIEGEIVPQFKLLFETLLDGDLSKIDYDNLEDCEALARQVFLDFFTANSGLTKTF